MINKDTIDIVILDIIMPKLKGVDLYKRIKEINPDIKAILTSGYDNEILNNENKDGEISKKPYSKAELLYAIEKVFRNRLEE